MLKVFYIIVLISLCECQCPSDYTYIKGGCFKAYNYVSASWDAAQNLCASNQNGHLAIIDSCSLLGDLAVYFHLSGIESTAGYWIGATDIAEEGSWTWNDETNSIVTLGASFWASVQQDGSSSTWFLEPSGGVNENCALLSPSDQYYFRDENCNKGANPLCQTDVIGFDDNIKKERPPLSDYIKVQEEFCLHDFQYISGQCFFFKTDSPLQWKEAREFCQLEKESEIVVLQDCELFGSLVSFITSSSSYNSIEAFWIGATDKGDEGAWYWIDNTSVRMGPPFWGQANGTPEPGENAKRNCGMLYKDDNYYFHDADCDQPSNVICQRDPP